MTALSVCVSAGENVVRGHRESVKNLLEIFEGLLEYLMEEMSEESQNEGWHKLFVGFEGHNVPYCLDEGRRSRKKKQNNQ